MTSDVKARHVLASRPHASHWLRAFADKTSRLHFHPTCRLLHGFVGQREAVTLTVTMNNTPEASQLMLLFQLPTASPGTKVRFLGWFVYFSLVSPHPHSLTFIP
jgi:hypothetical protein